MSIEAMSQVLNYSKAQGRAKIVLIGIANHMGDQGSWPSIETLARYANASERSVKRDLQDLVALGELRIEYQAAPIAKQYKTNLYWITLAGVTDGASGVTTQVSRGDRLGNSGVTPVGTQTVNRTLKERESNSTAIKADWKPSEELALWAKTERPNIDVDSVVAVFVDYWLGVGKPMKNWDATFRNWVRREKVEAVSAKVWIDSSKQATDALLAEEAEARKRAALNPPELCSHGRVLVICDKPH